MAKTKKVPKKIEVEEFYENSDQKEMREYLENKK